MANAWLTHVKQFWAKHKGKMSYRQALVAAKKTYKKKSAPAKKKDPRSRRIYLSPSEEEKS